MSVAIPLSDQLGIEVAFANAFADKARVIALRYFRQPHGLTMKADETPVTMADTEIEAVFRDEAEVRFAQDGIFGEETGVSGQERDRIWVIDPIDGTGAFATGSPQFGVLLSLVTKGRAEFGIIDACAMGERWFARRGSGATLNGVACAVSGQITLANASISSTSIHQYEAWERQVFDRLASAAAFARLGGDCYAYGLLAAGHLDLVIECALKPFDFMALTVIIEEAGGVISDWNGQPLSLKADGRVLASASYELHNEALGVISATR